MFRNLWLRRRDRLLADARGGNYHKCRPAVYLRRLPRPAFTQPTAAAIGSTLKSISDVVFHCRSVVVMAKVACSLVMVAMLSASGLAVGQDAMLEELYGRGVHAYFSGNMAEAFNSLDAAIRSGCSDPRAFYYRGLVLNRYGRPVEAADDFRRG